MPASKVVATSEATAVLRRFGIASPQLLVLEDLAWALGVMVVEGTLETADARLVRNGQRGLIRIRHDIPEAGRKRFAIAHELGHWTLHSGTSQLIACTADDMVKKYKSSEPELEANAFAAELLMPKSMFSPMIKHETISFELLSSLANHFRSSFTATSIHFVDVTQDCCAVVISEQGRIKWWRGSSTFEERFWIEPGLPVSKSSLAHDLINAQHPEVHPQEVDADAWVESRTDEAIQCICEASKRFERYAHILTLLYFE